MARRNSAVICRFGDEVRPEESYFEDIDDKADPDLVPLVQQLIKSKTSHWSPDMASNPIQTSLLKLTAPKKKLLKPKKNGKGKTATARVECREHHGCAEEVAGVRA